MLAIPFEQLKFILTKVSPDDESYHLLFALTVYPGLYLLMMQTALPNIFVSPIIATFYLIGPDLFEDKEETDK